MKNLKLLGLGCLLSIYATTASAELLIDTTDKSSMGKGKAGVFFGMSKVDYKGEEPFPTVGIKRQYISGYYAYGFSKDIDIFVAGGHIIDAKGKGASGDSGLMYGGGIRGVVPTNKIKINWYGQYIIFDEEFGSADMPLSIGEDIYGNTVTQLKKVNFENKLKELSVGLTAVNTSHGLTSYAGIEYVVLSDGKFKLSASGYNDTQLDIERKEKLGFRVGVRKKIKNILFSLNAAFNSEETFSIGASTKF